MRIPRAHQRSIALALLWGVVGIVGFLMAIQAVLLLAPFGRWQWPGIAQVTVQGVYQDPEDRYLTNVHVLRDGRAQIHTLLRQEARGLEPGDELWVLDNYHATPIRPGQFRLTPQRILLEYPQPLLLLTLLGIWLLRRWKPVEPVDPDAPPKVRIVLKDEFHSRANRFDSPRNPGNPA